MDKKQPQEEVTTQKKGATKPTPEGNSLDIRINLLSQVAKQLKTVGVIALFLSLPLAAIFFLPRQQPTAYPVEPELVVSPSPEAVGADVWRCRFGGGEWQEFANSCIDLCQTETTVACAQVVTEGCACGEGQCWDGEKCVLESKPSFESLMMESETPLLGQ